MSNLATELQQSTGSENLYKHWLGLHFTEGVKYLADQAECYWLLDAIGSYQPQLKADPELRFFQVWQLRVDNHSALLTCWPDSPGQGKPSVSQSIEFTDFPLPEIKLFWSEGILMLPREY
jgi:hypothetical protein